MKPFLAILALTTAAHAECGPRVVIEKLLTENMRGTVVASGATWDGWVMETWVAPQGRWTIVVTNGAGLTCILAYGDKITVPQPGAPA